LGSRSSRMALARRISGALTARETRAISCAIAPSARIRRAKCGRRGCCPRR
jgi:hypothetical protein